MSWLEKTEDLDMANQQESRVVRVSEGRTIDLQRCPAPVVLDGCESCYRFDEPEGRGVFALGPDGRDVLDLHLEEVRDLPGLLRLFRDLAAMGIDEVRTSGVMRTSSQDDIATEPPPARARATRS
jgi:hypothetical protein